MHKPENALFYPAIRINYAEANPKSPIIPWMLYAAIRDHGYSNYYQRTLEQIARYIPANVNNLIKTFLARQKMKAPGSIFPLIEFVKANTPKSSKKNKYTLIEFWFSECAPCIAQFRLLKTTYQRFNEKGFNIIAISIDKKEKLLAYENVIKKNGYQWQQILDVNGTKTKSIDIYEFPSNFLLDSQGRIIKTNVKPIVLDAFLEDNL